MTFKTIDLLTYEIYDHASLLKIWTDSNKVITTSTTTSWKNKMLGSKVNKVDGDSWVLKMKLSFLRLAWLMSLVPFTPWWNHAPFFCFLANSALFQPFFINNHAYYVALQFYHVSLVHRPQHVNTLPFQAHLHTSGALALSSTLWTIIYINYIDCVIYLKTGTLQCIKNMHA